MKKLTRKELDAEQRRRLRLYYLHRECVRRNPRYHHRYQTVSHIEIPLTRVSEEQALRTQWGLWHTDDLPVPDQGDDFDQLRQGVLPERSQTLTGNLEVDVPENHASKQLTRLLLHPHRQILEEVAPDLKGFVFLLYFPEETDTPFPALWSLTALDMTRGKAEIEEGFQRWVHSKLTLRASHGLSQLSPDIRLHLDEAFEYLWAYDLKRKGKTFREIAAAVWPNRIREERTRQAKTYYENGKHLVEQPPLLRLNREHVTIRSGGRRRPWPLKEQKRGRRNTVTSGAKRI
jgi:hypothetical protein